MNFKVLHAVTSSLSLVLLNGQMDYLRKVGFEPAIVCGSGKRTEVLQSAESIPVFTTAIEREISPLRDLLSLCSPVRPGATFASGNPERWYSQGRSAGRRSGMAQPRSLPGLHLARSARGDRTRNQAPHSYPDRAHRLRLRESRCLRKSKPATACR